MTVCGFCISSLILTALKLTIGENFFYQSDEHRGGEMDASENGKKSDVEKTII